MPARRPVNVGNDCRNIGKTEGTIRTRLKTAVDKDISRPPGRSRKCEEKAIAVALAIHAHLVARGRGLDQALRLLVRGPLHSGRAARRPVRTLLFSSHPGVGGALFSPPACMCGFSSYLGCSLGLVPCPQCL